MLGYDWPRVHAMLTALPVALLTTAVLCELAALVWRSESLRQTGFVTLVAGTLGAGAAVIAGLQAEDRIDHGPAIHALMEEHQELGLITLGIFAVVAIWRVARRRRMGGRERLAAFVLSVAGLLVLVDTAHHGGKLVFEHAAGVSNAALRAELEDRGAGHEHAGGAAPEHGPGGHEHGAGAADEREPGAHERGEGEAGAGHAHGDAGPAGDSGAGRGPGAGSPPHAHPPGTPPHRD